MLLLVSGGGWGGSTSGTLDEMKWGERGETAWNWATCMGASHISPGARSIGYVGQLN